eukprot:CAMPEP_0197241552 /NCGR_PEP_ID=MMETSP1429-20130617/7552_1 /TAXON_ID=49237 /ORGANISM="Chaetoceros  sp., Strain UNC1202" /LENGTH=215 /DNA_ID=CAMNT_0042701405 /DNA_START=170 /DNA_END=817 /DNA_ORIENTATION=+
MARITTVSAPLKQLQRFLAQAHQSRHKLSNATHTHQIIQCRSYTKVPEPTWSLDELNLKSSSSAADTITTTSTTDEELDALAQRCCLNVKNLPPSERDHLKAELSNIMKCLTLVCETNLQQGITTTMTEEEMYDLPRGFHDTGRTCNDDDEIVPSRSCPVRNKDAELNSWEGGVREESRMIMDQLKLGGKVTVVKNERGEDEDFFSISTKTKSIN